VKAVFDTSPISYLLLIEEIELLPALYDRIFIPLAVKAELLHPRAPSIVRKWMTSPPAWLEIHPVVPGSSRELDHLQAGEREAILLAKALETDQVVLDDLEAREAARELGLGVTGLIGIVDQAAARELIDLPGVVERLQQTSFRAAPRLLKNLLDRYAR
jgi:predicted nucleic acid-binding protein